LFERVLLFVLFGFVLSLVLSFVLLFVLCISVGTFVKIEIVINKTMKKIYKSKKKKYNLVLES
jgi:hypothetical protein